MQAATVLERNSKIEQSKAIGTPFDRQTDTQVTKTLNDRVIGLKFLVKFRVAIYHGERMISQSKEWACERHL